MKLINIGFGNMVAEDKIVAIISPESAPIKRIIQDAREKACLIDATYGRKTRGVVITNSEQIILCAISPLSISKRIDENIKTDFEEIDDE